MEKNGLKVLMKNMELKTWKTYKMELSVIKKKIGKMSSKKRRSLIKMKKNKSKRRTKFVVLQWYQLSARGMTLKIGK